MKLGDLHKLAAYHQQCAANAAQAAKGMGDCPAARDFLAQSEQHSEWAAQLIELAGAFERFHHPLGEK